MKISGIVSVIDYGERVEPDIVIVGSPANTDASSGVQLSIKPSACTNIAMPAIRDLSPEP